MKMPSQKKTTKAKKRRQSRVIYNKRRKVRRVIEKVGNISKSDGFPPLLCIYIENGRLKFEGHEGIKKALCEITGCRAELKSVCVSSLNIPSKDADRPVNPTAETFDCLGMDPAGVNPEDLNIDHLRKIVSQIVTPIAGNSDRSTWGKRDVKPQYWPEDIPFVCPCSQDPEKNKRILQKQHLIDIVCAWKRAYDEALRKKKSMVNFPHHSRLLEGIADLDSECDSSLNILSIDDDRPVNPTAETFDCLGIDPAGVNPEDLTIDQLRKIVSRIGTPIAGKGSRSTWGNSDAKPPYWPEDIPFVSPTTLDPEKKKKFLQRQHLNDIVCAWKNAYDEALREKKSMVNLPLQSVLPQGIAELKNGCDTSSNFLTKERPVRPIAETFDCLGMDPAGVNPEDLTVDRLRKIVSRIGAPIEGKFSRSTWGYSDAKPPYWPEEIPFVSPSTQDPEKKKKFLQRQQLSDIICAWKSAYDEALSQKKPMVNLPHHSKLPEGHVEPGPSTKKSAAKSSSRCAASTSSEDVDKLLHDETERALLGLRQEFKTGI